VIARHDHQSARRRVRANQLLNERVGVSARLREAYRDAAMFHRTGQAGRGVLRRRIDRMRSDTSSAKPSGPPTEAEVRFWLRQFGLEESPPESAPKPPIDNPFPPGYAEDLFDEDT
jgi:hypothetical protein